MTDNTQIPSITNKTNDIILELMGINEQALLNGKATPHVLYIDEFDNFHHSLSPADKDYFRSYWAVARHYGLQHAIFVTRRYIQIPIHVRSSATAIFINHTITAYDLKQVAQDRGMDVDKIEINQLKEYEFMKIE